MTEPLPIAETSRLIASDLVNGTPVYSNNGEHLGSIRNFMVDKASGRTDYAVLQFGGFLGIGNDYYPIPWEKLSYEPIRSGYVVDITPEQIKSAPRYGEEVPVYDKDYDRRLTEYYQSPAPIL
ncbi:PRC-barrel domain-containing protein [Novosphingobium terrae]|uniref:PRC-barrel domain-containing protein n=1 Tax=Novosphingobium terrae TaxID=2726189 RepID=UPI00197F8660|nr:PRC-barrel domain-containing protein [Novosphingobium terrae]